MKYGPISDENLEAAIKYRSAEDIDILRMAEELRSLRTLLLTPIPCGFDSPRFVRQVGHGGIDGVEWNPFGTNDNAIVYEPDEAVAIGAALIRAGLEAQSALAGKGDSK